MIIVNPNNKTPSPMAAIEPPIWCAYLAAYYGARRILDAEAEGLTLQETVDRIERYGHYAILVAMGANPSASSTPKVDVCNGIINILYGHTPNIHYAGLHWGYGIPEPKELVKLKPRWDLINFSKYRAHNWQCLDGSDRANYGVIFTSFGCPFNCSYCNIHAIYKTRKVTFRDPEDVLAEIDFLVKEKGVRNLKIADELFVLNKKHVNAICDGLIERDYGLNIWAYARVDTINSQLLEKLKKAGFNWLCYGFESVSSDGEKYAVGSAYKAVEMTKRVGINILGNFMFGLPEETLDDWQDTWRLASYLQCEYVNFYVALPYPGSQWYESLKDKNTDWSSYSQFAKNMCADPEVVRFRDRAFIEYFTNPDYQSMIKDKFGQQAVDHIRSMLEWSPRPREMPSSVASLS